MISNNKVNRDTARGSFARHVKSAPPIPDGVLTPVTLSINGTPARFDVSAFLYAIGGKVYCHAASTGHALSAIHATGIAHWLGALVMIDRLGAITTKGYPDTGDQDFGTEALALASFASLDPAASGKIAIGSITLLTNAADWDGNTDAFNEADLVAINWNGDKGDRRWFSFNPGSDFQVESVRTRCRSLSGIAHVQVAHPKGDFTGLLTHPRVAVDARTVANTTTTKLKHGGFDYVIDGVTYHKAAGTALAFTAAHLVSLDCWGSILLRINAAGTFSTLVTGATQTTAMAYANSAAALAALPAAGDGYAAVAAIVIEADASTWTANTDDLVAGSDLEAVDIRPIEPNRLLSAPALAVHAGDKTTLEVGTFTYVIDGVTYSKTGAGGIAFTSAKVVSIGKWMGFTVQIDTAGTVTTLCPIVSGRSLTAATGYDTQAAAFAALPPATPGKLAIGHILLLADTGTWTAGTDDMVEGATGDLTTVVLTDAAIPSHVPFACTKALFAAETRTAATLATELAARRGQGEMTVLIGGTTGIVTAPELDITYRPYPLAGEV